MYALQKGESNKENIKTLIGCSNKEEVNEADLKDCTALQHVAKMTSANKTFLKDITRVLY